MDVTLSGRAEVTIVYDPTREEGGNTRALKYQFPMFRQVFECTVPSFLKFSSMILLGYIVKTCFQCGRENEDQSFCGGCGSSLELRQFVASSIREQIDAR